MKLLKKEEKPLLGRTEALVEIEFAGATPSLPEIKKKAAIEFKTKEDLVDVYKVHPQFGERKIKAEIHAYQDEKSFKDFRISPKVKGGAAAPKTEEVKSD